jgi:hypothetical protein
MIVVRTIITVLPEKQKEVLQTLPSLIAQLEEEKGCPSYDIYSDIVDEQAMEAINNRLHMRRNLVCNEAKPQIVPWLFLTCKAFTQCIKL